MDERRPWLVRRGVTAAASIAAFGVVLAMFVLMTGMYNAEPTRTKDPAAAAAAVINRLHGIGDNFAVSAGTVLPTIVTTLVALTIVQVVAVAPRFLLLTARILASVAIGWALLSLLSLYGPEPKVSELLTAATVALMCLALGVVIVEFTSTARTARLESLDERESAANRTIRRAVRVMGSRKGSAPSSQTLATQSLAPLWRRQWLAASATCTLWLALPSVVPGIGFFVAGSPVQTAIGVGLVSALASLIPLGSMYIALMSALYAKKTKITTAKRTVVVVGSIIAAMALGLAIAIPAVLPDPSWELWSWTLASSTILFCLSASIPLYAKLPLDSFLFASAVAAVEIASAELQRGYLASDKRIIRRLLATEEAATARSASQTSKVIAKAVAEAVSEATASNSS